MTTADFASLVVYFDRRFDSIEREMAKLEERFFTLQGRVEANARRADAFAREMLTLTQTTRHRER